MAIKKYVLSPEEQLTEDQILMVREAAKRPLAADDDNPELTDEQMMTIRNLQTSSWLYFEEYMRADRQIESDRILRFASHRRQFRKQRLWGKDTAGY